uniref:Reverse transcriptase domain-containing protein n=1 Tax=Tanacetum cinerariifolium TaxID=118510 RepID=A0A699HR75_TANCI|nr:reverse transcriptase domain-containing protein [Tanacetum cinerariifolium]
MEKINLNVTFGSEGLCRRTMMKFTVVWASSPYNIILGRTSMKETLAISSPTHALINFPTPRGIATLVARKTAIFECRRLEEKKMIPERSPNKEAVKSKKESAEEEVLINPAFPEQQVTIEAYMDDMVIKSKTDQEMIIDIAETIDNLRKVNMKLNPKKCSFRVKKGKFLGYMDVVSGVLVSDHKGKQTPIRYVSRILHEAEKNYAPLEKLSLCLLHLSRRLRRYFEAHLIKVITDPRIKQILNKPKVSGKLAKYAVKLGAYNITYVPRNTITGQVLADFMNEVSVQTKHLEICNIANEGNVEEWTLYTDRASSLKGVGAGLVLIDPT